MLYKTVLELPCSKHEVTDFSADVGCLIKNLKKAMDSTLKRVIQKRGITLMKNTYAGFDTEYALSSYKDRKNSLVSWQLAVNSKFFLKVPRVLSFRLGVRNAESDAFYPQKDLCFFEKILQESIGELCLKIRGITSPQADFLFNSLSESLKSEREFVEKETHIVFAFQRSHVSSFIDYPCSLIERTSIENENENDRTNDENGLSFSLLLKKIECLNKECSSQSFSQEVFEAFDRICKQQSFCFTREK